MVSGEPARSRRVARAPRERVGCAAPGDDQGNGGGERKMEASAHAGIRIRGAIRPPRVARRGLARHGVGYQTCFSSPTLSAKRTSSDRWFSFSFSMIRDR